MTLLVFNIKDYRFGFPIDFLDRIIVNDKPIYQVPLMPNFIKGIFNFQGRVITTFDIADFYEIEDRAERSYVLISKTCPNIGYLVKNVFGFIDVPKDSLEDAAKFDFNIEKIRFIKYIAGKEEKSPLYMLNIEEIEGFIKNPKNWGVIYEV